MDGTGAASSATLSPRAPTEVAATGDGRSHLLSCSFRLCVAHAATSHPAIDARPVPPGIPCCRSSGERFGWTRMKRRWWPYDRVCVDQQLASDGDRHDL